MVPGIRDNFSDKSHNNNISTKIFKESLLLRNDGRFEPRWVDGADLRAVAEGFSSRGLRAGNVDRIHESERGYCLR